MAYLMSSSLPSFFLLWLNKYYCNLNQIFFLICYGFTALHENFICLEDTFLPSKDSLANIISLLANKI